MLQCDQLVLRQDSFHLTADINFGTGGVTALIGPSGAGKSTLLSAIAGFLHPESGQIKFGPKDLTTVAPGQRPVSILFQENNLFPHLTIAQNIGLALQPRLRQSAQDKAKVNSVLDRVGLNGLGDRRPANLSGGQQSRAALARILLGDRPINLMDEPFAALGPGLKQEMLALVSETLVAANKTVIMVTHDPRDVQHIADETVFVAEGVAHAPVDTQVLFSSPPEALKHYLGGFL